MIDEISFLKAMIYDLHHTIKVIEDRIKRLKKQKSEENNGGEGK